LNGEVSAQLPEIIHIFTKRDKMGYEGYKRQVSIVEGMREKGFIDKFFFVSSVDLYNLQELKQCMLNYENEYDSIL
jgi:GTP-binding protein EngB required for normal cell division